MIHQGFFQRPESRAKQWHQRSNWSLIFAVPLLRPQVLNQVGCLIFISNVLKTLTHPTQLWIFFYFDKGLFWSKLEQHRKGHGSRLLEKSLVDYQPLKCDRLKILLIKMANKTIDDPYCITGSSYLINGRQSTAAVKKKLINDRFSMQESSCLNWHGQSSIFLYM